MKSRIALPATLLSAFALLAPLQAQEMTGGPLNIPDSISVLAAPDPSVRKATALVNGEVITDTDIEQRLNLVVAANGGAIGAEERERLRMQILRNLIDEKLQIQEARSQDIVINDEEVQQTFLRVAQNFKREPNAFAAYLKSIGSSEASLKQQIRGELAWSRLLRRRVEPFVNVGDEEVQAIIKRLDASKGSEEYRVGQIFLSATPETQETVMANARRIAEQVRAGASFIAYARQFSEDSSAAVGGDLGWIQIGQLPEAVGPILQSLQAGQVGEPVAVPGGVVLVALIDKRRVLAADPRDAVLSLKQISLSFPPGFTQTQAAPRVEAFNKATRAIGGCGNVEAVGEKLGAEVVANDEIRIRDLPPQLQPILERLNVGEATPPFGSLKDGIRVLVLCGRDDSAAVAAGPSFEEVYAQLNEQRVNMRARRYLRDLRRDAVVDYR